MSGIVCQVIDRKENDKTGVASLTLLDTDFVGATLTIGDDPNYPNNESIDDFNYIQSGTILSKQLLNNTRDIQINQYDDPISNFDIKYAIEQTNIEVSRFGHRVQEQPFDFITDINASWYPTRTPSSHNVGQSADYDVLKEYAENVKKLYGFTVEHSAYCERLRQQLAEWSRTGGDYDSTIVDTKYSFSSSPTYETFGSVVRNDYNYSISTSSKSGTINDPEITPIGATGIVEIKHYIAYSQGTAGIRVRKQISRKAVDNDNFISVVTTFTPFGGAPLSSSSSSITLNGQTADHFDKPVGGITLNWLQTRVFF